MSVDRSDAVNLARNAMAHYGCKLKPNGVRILCEAVIAMDRALSADPWRVAVERQLNLQEDAIKPDDTPEGAVHRLCCGAQAIGRAAAAAIGERMEDR